MSKAIAERVKISIERPAVGTAYKIPFVESGDELAVEAKAWAIAFPSALKRDSAI